mmetsp:Transcript_1225/g.1865  ORF Transcript_1225/g.1865 Transcript_1225/m.1865 type:complete len:403 (+) Transcript_1225:421-1629(+)
MNEGGVTVSLHNHLVIPQLLSYITRTGSRDLNPSLGEEGTGSQDEDEVEDSMEGIVNDLSEGGGWRDVVCDSSDGDGGSTSLGILPFSEQTYEDVCGCTVVEELGYEVQVGNEGSLEDDGHVGGVEELDGVSSCLSAVLLVLDGEIDAPSLEVDNDNEDENGGEEVGQVGEVLTVKGLLESTELITAGDHEMEEGNDGSLELGSASGVESSGGEGLPDDSFTNVGSDEEGDTRSKTVSLLEQLIKSQNDESCDEKLHDDENGITGTKGAKISVHSTDDVGNSLTDGDQNTKKLLGTVEKSPILLHIVVNLDDTRSCKELHDETGGDNGGDTEFHECSTVGGENNAHPVKGIGRLGGLDSIDWDLATNQENEEGDGGPEELLTEGDLAIRTCDLGEDAHYWAD